MGERLSNWERALELCRLGFLVIESFHGEMSAVQWGRIEREHVSYFATHTQRGLAISQALTDILTDATENIPE